MNENEEIRHIGYQHGYDGEAMAYPGIRVYEMAYADGQADAEFVRVVSGS